MMLQRPAGIVFDLDGTLLDTEPLYAEAVDKILTPLGLRYEDHIKQRCMGLPSHRSAEIIVEAYALSCTIEAFIADRERHLRMLLANVEEIPGASRFVSTVAGHIPVALATSTYAGLASHKLAATDWGHLIETRVYGDDPRIKHGKPAPDIFLLAAERIDQSPATCIAFEDSPNGIRAAKAAGMTVVGIASAPVKARSVEPDLWIEDYSELMHLFAHWLNTEGSNKEGLNTGARATP